MGRIRTIKPEFSQSESMGRLSREARLLFVLLWTIADDAGRARATSRGLASLLYPYDDDAVALLPQWMVELEDHGHIRQYQSDGNSYLDIPNWLKHQKIDRPSPSKIPPFSREFVESSTNSRRTLDEASPPDSKGKDSKGGDRDRDGTGTGTRPIDPSSAAAREAPRSLASAALKAALAPSAARAPADLREQARAKAEQKWHSRQQYINELISECEQKGERVKANTYREQLAKEHEQQRSNANGGALP